MTRRPALLGAVLLATTARCGSATVTPGETPDLAVMASPDLSIAPDLRTALDLTAPPDLTPTPDLVSVADPGSKLFLSGGTFSNEVPAMSSVTLPQVGNGNYPNMPPADPQLTLRLAIGPLYGTYVPNGPAFGATLFKVYVDAMSDLGQAIQIELIYDFNGDGSSVRTEFYKLFATDPVKGWEVYSEQNGLWSQKGGFANFVGGTLTARVWKTNQPNPAFNCYYQEGTSYLLLPYRL